MLIYEKNGLFYFSKTKGLRIDGCKLPVQPLQPFVFDEELQNYVSGKQLLEDELPFSLDVLTSHYQHGYLQVRKGIEKENNRYRCCRCQNDNQSLFYHYHCARCQSRCTYCRHCVAMGRVSECTPLFTWCGPLKSFAKNEFHWQGTLSTGQQKASDEIVNAVTQKKDLLVWAVCGAGKTEMMFAGIAQALQQGKRVCLAAPRKDVVLELSPRLKDVFPHTTIATLYGGSEEKYYHAQLVLTTTHQLFRFKEAFQLMIVDEVDAFPYSFDVTLQRAVTHSRHPNSSLILLTATPSKKQRQEWSYVWLPRRYHGFPLPVPTFSWCGNWAKKLQKGFLPSSVLQFLSQKINQSVFIFVPHVKDTSQVVKALKQHFSVSIEGVHGQDNERLEKVQRFRTKETVWIVTTTILERGVTIENSHVVVIGSEQPIFTESALVQMAGRVGRSKRYPTGDVVFFHYGKTEAMIRARKHIQACNEVIE